jgi:microsomal dipeptidase-like Zn-dependent dipeptidase
MNLHQVLILFFLSASTFAQNVFELMDLQTHVTMHTAYPFFGDSLQSTDEATIKKLTHKHQLKNVIFPELMANNSGSRILINGAITLDLSSKREKLIPNILNQIKAINDFARKNSDSFIVAKTPAEVRKAIHETNKTVIIHSIEGAKGLLNSQEDAYFWAQQGVAFMTLIHLFDDEFGSSAVNPGAMGGMMNLRGTIRNTFHPNRKAGLTEHGKKAIKWLARAGIMTDLSHMSPDAVDDALEIFKELKLPPLVTHSLFDPIHHNKRSLTRKQLLTIYELGGLYSMPISGENHIPNKPEPDFLIFAKNKAVCEGSLDSYRLSFSFVEKFLKEKFPSYDDINLSMGWQSDFNGWTNHSRPRYGRKGCYPMLSRGLLEVEIKGLAHPGLLSQYWAILKKEGMNTDSLKKSTEKFLRMWQTFLTYRR